MGNHGDFATAIDDAGRALAWGLASSGQLGDNSTTNKSSPVIVVGAHSFTQIAIGTTHTVALKGELGEAWCWGDDLYGELGDNTDTNSKSSPIAVLGGHSFVAVAAGITTSFGLKSNGTGWAWGRGIGGGLGTGTVSNRSTPYAMTGAHSYKKISAGYRGGIALKIDGSAWAWGTGSSGQCGNGATGNTNSPVAVIGNHSFISVCWGNQTTCALKADGSAWAWGSNTAGQVGDGTSGNSYSSPVAVIGSHSFIELFLGGTSASTETCIALKDDGSVWCWGANSFGQIGNLTTTSYSSPVQIIGSHSFTHIAPGSGSNTALKSNGTMWMWGEGTSGKLGDNTATGKSSPVLVVGPFYYTNSYEERLLKTWVDLSQASWHAAARAFVNVSSSSWARVIDIDVQVAGAWQSCL